MLKRKFLEFCDIKYYEKQSPEQLIIKRYDLNDRKIIVDEEK